MARRLRSDRAPRIRRGISGYIAAAVRKRPKQAVLLGAAVVATAALRTGLPWPVKWIFDTATSSGGGTATSIGIAAGLIVVLTALSLYIGWRVHSAVSGQIEQIVNRVRTSVLGYIQFSREKDLGYHAESATRFLKDIRKVSRGFDKGLANIALVATTILMMVTVMLLLDWRLGLVATLMLPLFWFPTREMVQGIEKRIKDAGRGSKARDGSIPFIVTTTARLIIASGFALLLWLGAGMIMSGQLTIGELAVFLVYLGLARGPMIDLQKAFGSVSAVGPSREEIDKLMLAIDVSAPEVPKRVPPRFEGRVAYYSVSLTEDRGSLEDITLKLRPNRRQAFVGGDTWSRRALLRLVLKLAEPSDGRVLIDGSDINDYDVAALRSQIGAVPSDPVLVDATIAEYVTGGADEVNEQRLIGALAETELIDWVESLEDGVDTPLNGYIDGLSRVRRRLLALARAAYQDPPILIIDEPTRDLDNDDKRAVVVAIDRVSRGRTTLMATDDLRIASRFDTIALLQDGSIIEVGSHDELIDAEGVYASQFQRTSMGPVLYATKPVKLTAIYDDRRQPENINPFLFIVGCPGSGVSLIEQMLERHPMVAIAKDTHFIPSVLKDSGARSDVALTDDLVDRARTFPNFDRLGLDNVEVYKAGGMSSTYAEFVTNLHNIFAKKQQKELVAVKAPVYCRDIRLLHDLFPWARYIHVVRDGRDVAMSVLERATRLKEAIAATNVETVPIGASALWWKSMVEIARRDGGRLGNRFYLEVRFEDLVDQPQTAARNISSFLELSQSGSVSEYLPGFGSLDSVSNGFQDWRSQMNREDVALFEALAGELLESLGYGRGVAEIPDEVKAEAERCIASWRAQKAGQGGGKPGKPGRTPGGRRAASSG